MHYLITGHTGFKGSWMTLLLRKLGHKVSGIALEPQAGGLFATAQLRDKLENHVILDIRSREELGAAIRRIAPDVVIHMAAQPLVIESYRKPVDTFDTNVTGTLNVLGACAGIPSLKAVLIVTTDKVYKDFGTGAYSEQSPLGGHDPYSASKAMADLLAQSWMNLDIDFEVGVARAGNVIGLGDVSAHRLLPDMVRAAETNKELLIRNPDSVRPWQHVLDCVAGYLKFVDHMLATRNQSGVRVLNFGPDAKSYKSVGEVVQLAQSLHPNLKVEAADGDFTKLKETAFLTLDSSLAREKLGWNDKIDFEQAVAWSLEGVGVLMSEDVVNQQITAFLGNSVERS